MKRPFAILNETIIACRKCPRLVAFREAAAATHWRKPVPGFGDPEAWLLILGLAPSLKGANRTGRIFTGDGSALFLMKVLYQAGFANQPISESAEDSLKLTGCYITAAVKCVPPGHHPEKEEFENCSGYLETEFFLLKNVRAVLGLGKLAFDSYQRFLIKNGVLNKQVPFAHGKRVVCQGWPTLFGAYHPSPQNTNTGKLTEQMFLDVLEKTQC